MTDRTQRPAAERLRALHHGARPLVLPNVWDAASARAVEAAGFGAVATSSESVAASLGWADGQRTPAEEMMAAVRRITRAVSVPVTADLEAGYGLEPDELAGLLVEAGAAGCNLEDTDHASRGLADPGARAAYVAEVLAAARRAGGDLVVNARVDVFVRGGRGDAALEDALARACAYADAGADCVYPILADAPTLASFAARHRGPVNAMAVRDVTPYSWLLELGVARISFAGALQRLAIADLDRRLRSIAAGEDDWDGGG